MPLVRAGKYLIYFAHIPKCGGSSVEKYLEARFGELAFLDRKFISDKGVKWTRSSPQHAAFSDIQRLLPSSFIDLSFTVVRHPVTRLISVFHWLSEAESPERRLTLSFGEWLQTLPDSLSNNPMQWDRHIRPMSECVPSDAHIFKLEDGLDKIVDWINLQVGSESELKNIEHEKSRLARIKKLGLIENKIIPIKKEIDFITNLYENDFQRFGYEPQYL